MPVNRVSIALDDGSQEPPRDAVCGTKESSSVVATSLTAVLNCTVEALHEVISAPGGEDDPRACVMWHTSTESKPVSMLLETSSRMSTGLLCGTEASKEPPTTSKPLHITGTGALGVRPICGSSLSASESESEICERSLARTSVGIGATCPICVL